jgi:hypothetical protein
MGIFRLIGAYIAGAWRFSLRTPLRFAAGYGGLPPLYIFLFLILFPIGLLLVLLGFDLVEIDRWLDAQGGWLDALFSVVFQIVCGIGILICLFAIGCAIFDRKNPEKPGIGCALLAAVAAYFLWFGMMYK